MATPRVCSIPNCGKPLKSRGLCNTHYATHWRAKQPKCTAAGCKNLSVSRGLCDSHYRKDLDATGRRIARPGEFVPCGVPSCDKPHSAFGYCEAHYARFKRHGNPTAGIASRGEGLAFIESVLSQEQTDECINWIRPFRGQGRKSYPSVVVDGIAWPAHRYVCTRTHGDPPQPDMESCHSCANKRCVNPKHLRWGTSADNGADRSSHGTVCRGEKMWNAKLTEDAVRAIRAAPPSVSHDELGRIYGISGVNAMYVRQRKTWRHVT